MEVLKAPRQLLDQMMELYSSKSEQQRRERAIAAMVIIAVLVILYDYFV